MHSYEGTSSSDNGSNVAAPWVSTNRDDVVETFLASSMVIPSLFLAQCLPILATLSARRRIHAATEYDSDDDGGEETTSLARPARRARTSWFVAYVHWIATQAEMIGWASPVIAIFASPNIESSFVIAGVCFALTAAVIIAVRRSETLWNFRVLAWEQRALALPPPPTLPQLSGATGTAKLTSTTTATPLRNSLSIPQQPWPLVVSVAITYGRISSLLFTALGIFCVDFPNFGERFMKSESFGLTLMDIGIGCSLYSSGLSEGLRRSSRRAFDRIVWQALPLFIIGGFRTGILLSIGYRFETTEYGRHWNAFLTFGMMPLLDVAVSAVAALLRQSTTRVMMGLGVLFIIVYQRCLVVYAPYLMDDELRSTLLEANKEGIASVFGCYMIYTFGKLYARCGFASGTAGARLGLGASVLACALSFALDRGFVPLISQQYSRRIGNAPYVLYAAGMNGVLTWIIVEIQQCVPIMHATPEAASAHSDSDPVPPTEQSKRRGTDTRNVSKARFNVPLYFGKYTSAVNRNQLLFFVAANIATGVTNLVTVTHNYSDMESYYVQGLYVAVLGALILKRVEFADRRRRH